MKFDAHSRSFLLYLVNYTKPANDFIRKLIIFASKFLENNIII